MIVNRTNSGFTLIELTVVIFLISMMLFLSIPKLHGNLLANENRKASLWILQRVQALKQRAVIDQKDYTLHIDMDSDRLWTSDKPMSEDTFDQEKKDEHVLPENLTIRDVEFIHSGRTSLGVADVSFYKEGYSDKAMIHLEDDDSQLLSLLIEPFLPRVKLYEEYITFEE